MNTITKNLNEIYESVNSTNQQSVGFTNADVPPSPRVTLHYFGDNNPVLSPDQMSKQVADENPVEDMGSLVSDLGIYEAIRFACSNPYMGEQLKKLKSIKKKMDTTPVEMIEHYGILKAIRKAEKKIYLRGHLDYLLKESNRLKQVAYEHPVEDMKYLVSVKGIDEAIRFASVNPYMEKQLKKLELIRRRMDAPTDKMIAHYGIFKAIRKAIKNEYLHGHLDYLFEESDRLKQIADEHPVRDMEYLVSVKGIEESIKFASCNPFMEDQLQELFMIDEALNTSSSELIKQHGILYAISFAEDNPYMNSILSDLHAELDNMYFRSIEYSMENLEWFIHMNNGLDKAIEIASSNPFMNEQHEELLRRYEERIELWNKGYDSD